jgi:hypothetical protein
MWRSWCHTVAQARGRGPLDARRPDPRCARSAGRGVVATDVGLTYLVGEQPEEIRITPDPERLARYGLTLQALAGKVEGANKRLCLGTIREDGKQID